MAIKRDADIGALKEESQYIRLRNNIHNGTIGTYSLIK